VLGVPEDADLCDVSEVPPGDAAADGRFAPWLAVVGGTGDGMRARVRAREQRRRANVCGTKRPRPCLARIAHPGDGQVEAHAAEPVLAALHVADANQRMDADLCGMRSSLCVGRHVRAAGLTSHTGLLGQRNDGMLLPTQAPTARRIEDIYTMEDSDDDDVLSAAEHARAHPAGRRHGMFSGAPETDRPADLLHVASEDTVHHDAALINEALGTSNPQLRTEQILFLAKQQYLIQQGVR
jgi:hypothetical protein